MLELFIAMVILLNMSSSGIVTERTEIEVIGTNRVYVSVKTGESEYTYVYEDRELSTNAAEYEAFVHEFLNERLGYKPEFADINVRIDDSKDGPVEWMTIKTEGIVYDVKYGAIECYAMYLDKD